ncbi:MAG TPA: GNAT family N-acetyltransferase [Nannocystaceae bacterium]|nr:GNAT family N-acetyltransferase [Nannocystaceae bacterium]
MTDAFALRLATLADVAAIAALQKASLAQLGAEFYAGEVLLAAVAHVSVVDRRLITDGTYFVACDGPVVVGCGGWSFRRKTFAGPGAADDADDVVVPGRDAARVRAMFVAPDRARSGIGARILAHCEQAARAAGFDRVELGATLSGEAFYLRHGYRERERITSTLGDGTPFAVVMMTKSLTP